MPDTNTVSPLRFKDYLEYAGFIMVVGLLKILPLCLAVRVGRILAIAFCFASHRSSGFISAQMKECFGSSYSEAEYRTLVDRFYTHLGCLFAECVRLNRINRNNVDKIVDWGDFIDVTGELVEKYQKGVFFATGHIGNWEFTGAASGIKGVLAGSVARPQDNPLIDRLVKEVRENSGQKIWDKDGAIIKLLQAIKHKKSVGILVDQDAGEQGLRVPFLGRNSSTNTAIAEIAIRRGIPIVPAAMVRIDETPMRFKIVYGRPIIPDTSNCSQEEVYQIMNQVNQELSKIITDYPQQWLWIHKRWKTPNPSDTRRYKRL